MFVLTIYYNDSGPFVATSESRGQLHVNLVTTDAGWLELAVHVGPTRDALEYVLERIGPGDRLRIQYDVLLEPVEGSMEQLASAARENGALSLQEGHRIGLDVVEVPASSAAAYRGVRLSHPEGGGFQLMLGTIAKSHARVFLMAGDETEKWHWQLPDLYAGDALTLEVVETTWCSDHEASPQDPSDDRLALELLFRTSTPGAFHKVTHSLGSSSRPVAVAAVDALKAAGFAVDGPWGADEHWHLNVSHEIVPTEGALQAARVLFASICPEVEHDGWRGELV